MKKVKRTSCLRLPASGSSAGDGRVLMGPIRREQAEGRALEAPPGLIRAIELLFDPENLPAETRIGAGELVDAAARGDIN